MSVRMLWSVKLAAMGPHWGVTGSQHRWTPLWKGQMSKIEWKVSYSFIKWVKLDSSRLMHVIDTPQGVVKGGEKKRRDEKWWGREREGHKTWEGQRLRHSEGRWRGGGGEEERGSWCWKRESEKAFWCCSDAMMACTDTKKRVWKWHTRYMVRYHTTEI